MVIGFVSQSFCHMVCRDCQKCWILQGMKKLDVYYG